MPIKIEIIDTLKLNTTYTFNFGNAVEDHNEGNKLENFKYIFSTGTYIDSLTTSGNIKDAKLIIKFLNKQDKEIATIEQVYHIGGIMGVGGGYNYVLSYRHENKWNKQKIQKNDVIKEYNVIHDEIINKYF